MTRIAKAVLLGAATGILGMLVSLVHPVLQLEENAGLDWLFQLRGARPPPADAVIISIDHLSARRLDLPDDPGKWPREVHAALVNRLVDAGAAVIVFDIFFREPRSRSGDAALASAIRSAGNVILFEYTKKEITRLRDLHGQGNGELLLQQLVPPVAQIAGAARELAPFPLPVYPVKVSQFWAFNPGTADHPTVPVVALQLFASARQPELLQRLARLRQETALPPGSSGSDRGVAGSIRSLRSMFRNDPDLARQLTDGAAADATDTTGPDHDGLLRALTRMYRGPDSYYLDFYGPPQTITTIPYAAVLRPEPSGTPEAAAIDLRDKVVFVGYSERLHPEQLDKFYTVYSQADGLNLSGVEISATAFANLLEDRHVRPPPLPAALGLLFGWGLLTGVLLRLLPVIPAIATCLGLCILYLGISQIVFRTTAVWLPLIVPLLLQAPLVLFAALTWHYLDVRRQRETIRTAFARYLPAREVDRLADEFAGNRPDSRLMYGICLSTDARQYTALSEKMEPAALGELMNAYYETLFEPIRRYRGMVSDVVGDAMLAIWASAGPEPAMRHAAIRAALDIDRVVNATDRTHAPHLLPTRIGLHTGQILLGSIGAADHYEYRAVGDIVNTSTRIQGMNTRLGTRILLTREVLEDITGVVAREIGTFLLAGKTRPLVIHELIGMQDGDSDPARDRKQRVFAEGLLAYRAGDLHTAAAAFTTLVAECNDSVARFYLERCRQVPPGPDWDGIIRMDTK